MRDPNPLRVIVPPSVMRPDVLIGPAKIDLRRAIAATGSIGAAARSMIMSRPRGRSPIGASHRKRTVSMLPRLLRCGLAAACALLAAAGAASAQPPPTVAAAADLQFAVEEIAARFQADTGRTVRLTFGSSGNFARQIEQGAPFALFMSADEELVFRVADAGRTVDRGTLYAVGRIVLMVPHGSTLPVDGELKGLAAALAAGRIRRFAIANPEHAPYGRRAEEALRHAGLWEAVRPHLVLGENVAQAAQFAISGNADGGIVAYSLALSERLSAKGRFALIPDRWHRPLRQRMVLLKGADETARRFHDYLQQPPARQILRRYGFVLPGEL